jgi:hypothetical protein
MEYDLILPLNKRQILLDWINTIDEPKCLLVSELSNLEDGSVFLEILKNFLFEKKQFADYHNLIESKENLNLKKRYELIFQILSNFVSDDKLNIFLPIEKLVTNSNMLLAFINLIKSLYESEKDPNSNFSKRNFASHYNNKSMKKARQPSDNNNLSLMESDHSSKLNSNFGKPHDLFELTEKEGERVTYISDIEAMSKNKRYHFRKNFESDYEQSNYSIVSEENKFEKIKQLLEKDKIETDKKLQIQRNKNTKHQEFLSKVTPQEMKITNSNFNILNKVNSNLNSNMNSKLKSSRISPNESRSTSPKLNHNFIGGNITKEYTPNQSFIKDTSKLYSRQEKSELMMTRGLPSKPISIEIGNHKFLFYKFLKPSAPVININFSEYEKYLPSCEHLKSYGHALESQEKVAIVDRSNLSNNQNNVTNKKSSRDKKALPSQLCKLLLINKSKINLI